MNRLTIGSIVTATLLLVGCGSGGGSGSSSESSNSTPPPSIPTSSLADSSTPTINEVENPVAPKIRKGYYVDSAVEGVTYQCGNENGTTDENGTFTFESGSDCSFTIGDINLRDINASLLEDNITIIETNETVAQLLQTLDSDGNASNGIQIPQSANSILNETLPSLNDLNQDILEAVHDRLNAEESNEYNGTVIDKNQTIEHLNATKADLEERHIRTNLDVEAEQRGRIDNNGTAAHGDNSIMGSINSDDMGEGNGSIEDRIEGQRGDENENSHNNSSINVENSNVGDIMSSEHSGSNRDENISPRDTVADSFGDMMGEDNTSKNNQEQEHSGNASAQSDNSSNSPISSVDTSLSNMGNNNASDSQEQEHSGSSSAQSDNSSNSSVDTSLSNMGNNNASDSQEQEHSGSSSAQSDNNQGSSNSSSNTSGTRGMGTFGRK